MRREIQAGGGGVLGADGKSIRKSAGVVILGHDGQALSRRGYKRHEDASDSSGGLISAQDVYEAKERLKARAKAYPRRRRTGLSDFLRMSAFFAGWQGVGPDGKRVAIGVDSVSPAGTDLGTMEQLDLAALRPLIEANEAT